MGRGIELHQIERHEMLAELRGLLDTSEETLRAMPDNPVAQKEEADLKRLVQALGAAEPLSEEEGDLLVFTLEKQIYRLQKMLSKPDIYGLRPTPRPASGPFAWFKIGRSMKKQADAHNQVLSDFQAKLRWLQTMTGKLRALRSQ